MAEQAGVRAALQLPWWHSSPSPGLMSGNFRGDISKKKTNGKPHTKATHATADKLASNSQNKTITGVGLRI